MTLAEKFPDIAGQWHATLNGEKTPDNMTPGSSKKVWWTGECGHHWDEVIKNRTKRGSGCPYCSGRRVLAGFNDIETTHPHLIDQWSDENDMSTYGKGSSYYAKWSCDLGHVYKAQVKERTKKNPTGCPYCNGKKVLAGFNDMATTHPEIASLWDRDADTELSPETVTAFSNKRGFWKCPDGHVWDATISQITSGHRCPVCAGQKPEPGVNDISITHPDIASMWSENNTWDITEISSGSNRIAEWSDECGHQWSMQVSEMVRTRSCPYCSGGRVLSGFNDLATTNPEAMTYWSGRGISPEEVAPWSRKDIEWTCSHGHEWITPASEFSSGCRCPYCSGHRVISGFNDLQSYNPELAKQWDYEKNIDLTPDMVTPHSGKKAWWLCDQGHSWIAIISDRQRGNGCRRCSAACSAGETELITFLQELLGEDSVVTNDRTMIAPYEIDAYIPEKSIAIEFNGLYWHSEAAGKDHRYHHRKWKMCRDRDIQLITVWEDDWRDRREIVKSMIAHKLGVSDTERVYARKTVVRDMTYSESTEFLDRHHIQGGTSGSVYLGLDDGNGIVAVSVWKKNGDTLYLDRYATSVNVLGGMGKLLKAGKKWAIDNKCTEIVTFADHEVSDGGLYDRLGFVLDKELSPDYSYLVKGSRRHKFGYRIKRFRHDPDLKYQEGLTERELAELNGLYRIWDHGKSRYVLKL